MMTWCQFGTRSFLLANIGTNIKVIITTNKGGKFGLILPGECFHPWIEKKGL